MVSGGDENPGNQESVVEKCRENKEINEAFAVLEGAVVNSIESWTHDLDFDIKEAMEFYYKLLKKQGDLEENLSNLTAEESDLLGVARDFDLEDLNIYKDISDEERELLIKLSDFNLGLEENLFNTKQTVCITSGTSSPDTLDKSCTLTSAFDLKKKDLHNEQQLTMKSFEKSSEAAGKKVAIKFTKS